MVQPKSLAAKVEVQARGKEKQKSVARRESKETNPAEVKSKTKTEVWLLEINQAVGNGSGETQMPREWKVLTGNLDVQTNSSS
jgi:hypothetical protein